MSVVVRPQTIKATDRLNGPTFTICPLHMSRLSQLHATTMTGHTGDLSAVSTVLQTCPL